ncbi:MAG: hypothetical protein HC892_21300 [Saprospiraceae bacterium]|nr:hypothetical protein [Saprospiraceae bacterium]
MEENKTEQDYQALTDLVAINVLTQIAIHQISTDPEEGNHHSDSDDAEVINNTQKVLFGKSISLEKAWKLSRWIRAFFDR